MRYKYLFLILGLFLLFLFPRISLNYPFTLSEAKEAYTGYSLIKTGRDTNGRLPSLFFRADNDFLSTLGVYLRIPSVSLFGLTGRGVRAPGVIAGLIGLFIFYKLSRRLLSRKVSLIAAFLLGASPFYTQINIFGLGETLALITLFASFYFFLKKNTPVFLIFLTLSILSSLVTLPIAVILFSYYFYANKGVRTTLYFLSTAMIVSILLLVTNPQLGKFLVRQTIIQDLKPAAFTFEIDKRLSFGQIVSSPLITPKFNYNRLAFNKGYFGLTEFFKSLVKPLDYEYLTSSFQAQTILTKERVDTFALPKVFFWEAPLIFLGMVIFLKSKNKSLKILFFATAINLVIFKEKSLYLTLPIIVWLNSLSLDCLLQTRKTFVKMALVVLVLLFVGSYSDLIYRLKTQKYLWGEPNDVAQYQIWNFTKNQGFAKEKMVVTDRVGDPAFYYLFYNQIDPYYFQQNHLLAQTLIAGRTRILKVGQVEFRSFKYDEPPTVKSGIWVGLPGEFAEPRNDFSTFKYVSGGQIVGKIKSIKQANKLFGDELWFVAANNE